MATAITPSPFISGFRLIDGSSLNTNFGHPLLSFQDAITATASGTQTTALKLVARVNNITTVTSAADAVKLPASDPGKVLYIINNGANSLQVFGSGTDTINGVATATGIAQAAATAVTYACSVVGKWYTIGALTGTLGSSTGTFTANGTSTVTIANVAVTANSQVLITLKTASTPGVTPPSVQTITPGTGFTTKALVSDVSTYNYAILG